MGTHNKKDVSILASNLKRKQKKVKKMKGILTILALVMVSCYGYSQSCVGRWVTIDDNTGKKKSIVKLYKKDGKLYGKVIKLFPREGRGPNPKCTKCTDDRKDQPLVGLEVIRDMVWAGDQWEDGTITDPENGKEYSCKLWVDEDNKDRLHVKGYIGIFGRTQTWVRMPEK